MKQSFNIIYAQKWKSHSRQLFILALRQSEKKKLKTLIFLCHVMIPPQHWKKQKHSTILPMPTIRAEIKANICSIALELKYNNQVLLHCLKVSTLSTNFLIITRFFIVFFFIEKKQRIILFVCLKKTWEIFLSISDVLLFHSSTTILLTLEV